MLVVIGRVAIIGRSEFRHVLVQSQMAFAPCTGSTRWFCCKVGVAIGKLHLMAAVSVAIALRQSGTQCRVKG